MSTEERNLAAVTWWIELCNQDVHRMIDECYAEEFRVRFPGIIEITEKELYHSLERASHSSMPDCTVRATRRVAQGDTVAVELLISGTDLDTGETVEIECSSWLVFEGGLIVREDTYFDAATGQGMSDLVTHVLGPLGPTATA